MVGRHVCTGDHKVRTVVRRQMRRECRGGVIFSPSILPSICRPMMTPIPVRVNLAREHGWSFFYCVYVGNSPSGEPIETNGAPGGQYSG